MGKVTWGSGSAEAAPSADELDNAEGRRFKPYDGPPVPAGVYAWKITMLKKGKSNQGNDQLIIGLELVPRRGRADQKQYAGFRVVDYIPVMSSTAERLGPFLKAIGVSGADFLNRTTDDGQKDSRGSVSIVKIGKWVFEPGKTFVLAAIEDARDQKGNARKEVGFGAYWAPSDASSAGSDAAGSDDADADDSGSVDDDPPF